MDGKECSDDLAVCMVEVTWGRLEVGECREAVGAAGLCKTEEEADALIKVMKNADKN